MASAAQIDDGVTPPARRGYRDDTETGDFPGERVFHASVDVKYVLEEATEHPEALLVAFSAVHTVEETPRYYTHRALRAVPCHRLFVLDDHGPLDPLPRPCWYLGRDRRFDVADSVCELIASIAAELGIDRERLHTCGASKGGWAALYFAARVGAGHAVAGEPQAFLGKHLVQDGTYNVAAHIAGGVAQADSDFLDEILFDAFRAAARLPDVHLYCGRGSPYLDHDVRPLASFLEQLGAACEVTLGEHANHVPDLGLHFPAYLTSRLAALLSEPAGAE
jgi:hypothetical protein